MAEFKDRKTPETLRLRSVTPSFTVSDVEASIAWYCDVLGFIVAQRMERDGQLMGAVVQAGGIQILLGQDDWSKGRDRQKGVGMRLYCVSGQDIDQVAADIKARGGTLAQEPTDQPWGARDLAVVDPDGFVISISNGMSDG